MALRVAENVTATCSDTPLASKDIPTNGMALSFTFKVKNIAKRNAKIMWCMGERLGFVLTGEKFIVTTAGDSSYQTVIKSVVKFLLCSSGIRLPRPQVGVDESAYSLSHPDFYIFCPSIAQSPQKMMPFIRLISTSRHDSRQRSA